MSSEISSTALRCNACWKGVTQGKAYKTACNHLFCRGCAERHFGRKMECPLCDASVEGDGGLVELDAAASPEAAAACFAFAAFHLGDAQPVFADAVTFARAQTALYGTREVWLKDKDAEALQQRVVAVENRLHSCASELQAKAREAADLAVSRAARERSAGAQRGAGVRVPRPAQSARAPAEASARIR